MIKKLTQHGNSYAIVIDRSILELLNIDLETPLKLSTDGQALIVTPVLDQKRLKGTDTKISKVWEMFKERNSWTIQEIADRAGYDLQNARTAMSILKNPARTKKLLVTKYDKNTKTYTIVKS